MIFNSKSTIVWFLVVSSKIKILGGHVVQLTSPNHCPPVGTDVTNTLKYFTNTLIKLVYLCLCYYTINLLYLRLCYYIINLLCLCYYIIKLICLCLWLFRSILKEAPGIDGERFYGAKYAKSSLRITLFPTLSYSNLYRVVCDLLPVVHLVTTNQQGRLSAALSRMAK